MVVNSSRTSRPVNLPNSMLNKLGVRSYEDIKQVEYAGRVYRVNVNGVNRYVTSKGEIIK